MKSDEKGTLPKAISDGISEKNFDDILEIILDFRENSWENSRRNFRKNIWVNLSRSFSKNHLFVESRMNYLRNH